MLQLGESKLDYRGKICELIKKKRPRNSQLNFLGVKIN